MEPDVDIALGVCFFEIGGDGDEFCASAFEEDGALDAVAGDADKAGFVVVHEGCFDGAGEFFGGINDLSGDELAIGGVEDNGGCEDYGGVVCDSYHGALLRMGFRRRRGGLRMGERCICSSGRR